MRGVPGWDLLRRSRAEQLHIVPAKLVSVAVRERGVATIVANVSSTACTHTTGMLLVHALPTALLAPWAPLLVSGVPPPLTTVAATLLATIVLQMPSVASVMPTIRLRCA